MKTRQTVFLLAAAGVNLVLAVLCPSLDAPPPGDYRDYYPVATVFFMAPLLAASFTLAISGYCRFWSGRRRFQMSLLLAGLAGVCYTVIHAGYGMPFLWLSGISITAVMYIICLAELLAVRWVWDKLG